MDKCTANGGNKLSLPWEFNLTHCNLPKFLLKYLLQGVRVVREAQALVFKYLVFHPEVELSQLGQASFRYSTHTAISRVTSEHVILIIKCNNTQYMS